jgi:hypothetical protein
MNLRVDFWKNSQKWPRDSSSYVFLARAVQAFGQQMFPGEWTGNEAQIELMAAIPEGNLEEDVSLNFRIKKTVDPKAWTFPDKPKLAISPGGFAGGPPKATKDEWRRAREIVAEDHAAKMPALRRLSSVEDHIINLAEAGTISTAVRPLAGGKCVELPNWVWNGEGLNRRFHMCQINPDKPFTVASAGDAFWWIFVLKADLDVALKAIVPKKVRLARAGAQEKYDWEEAKLFMLQELEKRGDFLDPQNKTSGWNSQNDLVEKIIVHLAKHSDDGEGPAPSGVKAKVKIWLQEWRSGQ